MSLFQEVLETVKKAIQPYGMKVDAIIYEDCDCRERTKNSLHPRMEISIVQIQKD